MSVQIQALAFKTAVEMMSGLPPDVQKKIRVAKEALQAIEKAGDFTFIDFAHADAFVAAAFKALGPDGFHRWWLEVNRGVFALPLLRASLAALKAVGLGRLDPLHLLQAAPMFWFAISRGAGKFVYQSTEDDNSGTLVLTGAPAATIGSPGFSQCWTAAFKVLLELSEKASDVEIAVSVDVLSRSMTLRARWKLNGRRAA